jgi:hypothetical protein
MNRYFSSGQYRIDITFGNIPIEGSPFFTEIYDPLQVRISSLPKDILVGIENTFEIDLEKAGNAPLEVIITSTSGSNGKKRFRIKLEFFLI